MKNSFRKITQFLHLDTSYFIKNSFYATVQQFIGLSCGLAVSYLLGHFVSVQVYGEYNLVLASMGLLNFLTLSSIDGPLTKSVQQGFDRSLIEVTKVKLAVSTLAIPILIGFAFYYFVRTQLAVSISLFIAAFFFPLANAFSSYPAFLSGKKKFLHLSTLSSLASVFFLLSLWLGIKFGNSASSLTLSYLFAITFPCIASYFYTLRFVNWKSKTDPKLMSYGFFLSVISIIPWISGNLGSILLGNFLGVESLAIYAVASRFLTAVQKNFIVFFKPVSAKLAGQSAKQHRETLKTHGWKLIIMGFGLAALLYFSTPYLILFFFTEKYSNAIFFGQLISLALIPLPLSWTVGDMILYQKIKQPQVFMSTVMQFIKLASFFILIPKFGILGLIGMTVFERYVELLVPLIFLLKPAHRI